MSHTAIAVSAFLAFVILPILGLLYITYKQAMAQLRVPLMSGEHTVANLARTHFLGVLPVYAYLTVQLWKGRVERRRNKDKFPSPWLYTATDIGWCYFTDQLSYEAGYTPEDPITETSEVTSS